MGPAPVGAKAVVAVAAILSAAVLTCASPPKTAAPPSLAVPLRPLPRSSIAAVLEHQQELGLTPDQVQRLQAMDDRREQTDAQLRSELTAAPDGGVGSAASGGTTPGAWSPGMGMGGRHGGRMGRAQPTTNAPPNRAQAIQEKLDDDDTQAFLQAEAIFTDAQRDRAEDIAGAYRAELFDRRQPPAK